MSFPPAHGSLLGLMIDAADATVSASLCLFGPPMPSITPSCILEGFQFLREASFLSAVVNLEQRDPVGSDLGSFCFWALS